MRSPRSIIADNPLFIQITVPPRSSEPLGRQRYWPIYEAAQRHDLPIACMSAV